MAASTLISGCTFQRIKEVMSIAKIPFMSKVTFYSIQKRFLFPAVHRALIYSLGSNQSLTTFGGVVPLAKVMQRC